MGHHRAASGPVDTRGPRRRVRGEVGSMREDVVRLAVAGALIRRRWPRLVILAVLGALVGAGASLVVSPGYASTSRVLLQGEWDKTDTQPVDTVPEPAHPVTILDGAETPSPAAGHERHLGVGTVGPGAAWTDLARLGEETVLVVRAGHADTAWLHTVSRQLADAEITVLGVVLVHPDPRDRTDGTLWDELHAVRARAAAPALLGQPLIVSTNGHGHATPEIMEAR